LEDSVLLLWRVARVIAVAAALCAGTAAQGREPALQFDVASVKRSPDPSNFAIRTVAGPQGPGTWMASWAPLTFMIRALYPDHSLPGQIVGAPAWAGTDMFEIIAKTDPSRTPDEMRLMARALLAERFKLALHTEMRDVPAYMLVLAREDRKPGAGLSAPAIDCDAYRAAVARGERTPSGPNPFGDRLHCAAVVMPAMDHTRRVPGADTRLTAGGTPIAGVLNLIANQVRRPVIDRTGLTGVFDIELQFTSRPLAASAADDAESGPAFITALREQLGLKLEEGTAAVEVIVIDRAEPPSPN
jgi:uncharacterized protein (TIGR03435 family)